MEPAGTQVSGAPPQASAAPAATERLNFLYLVIIGVAMGLVAPFTILAWPIAIMVGMIVGHASVERTKGIQQRGAVHLLRALGVVGGVIAMLVLGALIGGLIALIIVALASLSERVSANAGQTDQAIGRILVVIVTVVVWIVLAVVLNMKLSINIGG